jgi:hypothetical protein
VDQQVMPKKQTQRRSDRLRHELAVEQQRVRRLNALRKHMQEQKKEVTTNNPERRA